jgi:hypothetical protein
MQHRTITLNEIKDIPYFMLSEQPFAQATDIVGTLSIGGFPADVGGISANGLVGIVAGGEVVVTISTLIYSKRMAIPPLLVMPKDKIAVISDKNLEIGFTLTTSSEAGLNWGFSRLMFNVTV